ncbi:MAG: glycosyltransferase [Bacteroidales bacterium]
MTSPTPVAPRKVSIIGSAWPLRGGGIATFNERLARAFMENGDSVSISTFSLQYPGFLFPGKTQYSDEPQPVDLDIKIRINSVNPLNWIQQGNIIKKERPDLVIVRYWLPFMAPCLGTISGIIRKNRHSKVIAIVDNIIPHEKRPGDRLLSSYFVNRVDGFICMSGNVLRDLETFDTKKPKKYCPHPLYDNYGEPMNKSEAIQLLNLDPAYKHLLFFGFVRDYKGLDLLLQAFADDRVIKLPVKLIIAGEFYSDPKPYFDLIEKYNLSDRLILRNQFIGDQDVRKYFSAADLVVQPYKSATQSGVTQIAYHFGVPMITTDVGGLAELVPHEKVGYVVNPQVREIADAIFRFFHENKASEFMANVQEYRKLFSWKELIVQIDSIVGETHLIKT